MYADFLIPFHLGILAFVLFPQMAQLDPVTESLPEELSDLMDKLSSKLQVLISHINQLQK